MIVDRPIYHYARVELEALTPHGIHAGRGDVTHDVLLVRDASGLPTLPGTSLAGVLRHLHEKAFGDAAAQALFGFAEGSGGQPSWLQIMAGLVHDSQDRAMEGLRDDVADDPVLAFLAEDKPLVRQRVCLDARGTAEDTGKFDTTLAPAGTRYTTFIGYWGEEGSDTQETFERLLSLLASPAFRLGHGTRSGSGAFRVQRLDVACWDLRTPEGRQAFCQRPRKRCSRDGLESVTPPKGAGEVPSVMARLPLQAEAGWRVGGGEHALGGADEQGRLPDLLPQSERCILWEGGRGRVSEPLPVIPGSALKGALAHRFVFHSRRLAGEFIEPGETETLPTQERHPLLRELFGWAGEGEDQEGQAGHLILDDLYLEAPSVARQMHNRIDRFTGGVIKGGLFEEELLWQTPLTLKVTLQEPMELSELAYQALVATFEDLVAGWLPMGAGGSRGQGVFIGCGDLSWSDGGQWLVRNKEEGVA